jgi:lysophospholipase L1-like esterase
MKTVSVILNILLLSAVVFLFVRGNFWDKTKNFLQEKRDIKNTHTYDMNRLYVVKKNMHMSYEEKARIVLFGDSHTEFAEWHELLGSSSIVNRGIAGDITEGMLKRIDSVLKVKPEICFFMGGINDFIYRVSYSKTIDSIIQIIRVLKENEIRPVIQSVLYIGKSYPESDTINLKVEQINKDLRRISEEEEVFFLDINSSLSFEGYLKNEFTYDGLHLNPNGYKVWAKVLSKILNESIK